MVGTRKEPTGGAPSSRLKRSFDPSVARTVYSLSEEETLELGQAFARHLRGGELILLEGDLGLGKTVFARGVAVGLGIHPEDVTSPSFTLVQEYHGGRAPMFHVDLYRLEYSDDTESLGLEEILASGGIIVVEWGDRLASSYRRDAVNIRFHDVGEGSRRIELLPRPPSTPTRRGDA